MNSENSKTFDPHRLLLNLLDKINFKFKINLKYQLRHEMKNLSYLTDHILY